MHTFHPTYSAILQHTEIRINHFISIITTDVYVAVLLNAPQEYNEIDSIMFRRNKNIANCLKRLLPACLCALSMLKLSLGSCKKILEFQKHSLHLK